MERVGLPLSNTVPRSNPYCYSGHLAAEFIHETHQNEYMAQAHGFEFVSLKLVDYLPVHAGSGPPSAFGWAPDS